jgi:serine/threonine protein kinase
MSLEHELRQFTTAQLELALRPEGQTPDRDIKSKMTVANALRVIMGRYCPDKSEWRRVIKDVIESKKVSQPNVHRTSYSGPHVSSRSGQEASKRLVPRHPVFRARAKKSFAEQPTSGQTDSLLEKLSGDQLDNYERKENSSWVFKGKLEDQYNNTLIACKKTDESNCDFVVKFIKYDEKSKNEIKIQLELSKHGISPKIVDIFTIELGSGQKLVYFVMKRMKYWILELFSRRLALTKDQANRIADQLKEKVELIHQLGYTHGDLLGNTMLDENYNIYVIDFGYSSSKNNERDLGCDQARLRRIVTFLQNYQDPNYYLFPERKTDPDFEDDEECL